MSDVMVRQEGYDLLAVDNGMFVHTAPDMTPDEAITIIPSTESE